MTGTTIDKTLSPNRHANQKPVQKQKTAFRTPKDRLLRCKRPRFTSQYATF